jgi:hypothetical protein
VLISLLKELNQPSPLKSDPEKLPVTLAPPAYPDWEKLKLNMGTASAVTVPSCSRIPAVNSTIEAMGVVFMALPPNLPLQRVGIGRSEVEWRFWTTLSQV